MLSSNSKFHRKSSGWLFADWDAPVSNVSFLAYNVRDFHRHLPNLTKIYNNESENMTQAGYDYLQDLTLTRRWSGSK